MRPTKRRTCLPWGFSKGNKSRWCFPAFFRIAVLGARLGRSRTFLQQARRLGNRSPQLYQLYHRQVSTFSSWNWRWCEWYLALGRGWMACEGMFFLPCVLVSFQPEFHQKHCTPCTSQRKSQTKSSSARLATKTTSDPLARPYGGDSCPDSSVSSPHPTSCLWPFYPSTLFSCGCQARN